MSLGGTEHPASEYRQVARRSLEEHVRQLGAPQFGDGSYYLGTLAASDEEYAEFLAGHYADRREGIA